MEGVVDFHLRKIFAAIGGIDACVTEFVRVTDHLLPERVFFKYCPELKEENRYFTVNDKTHTCLPIRIQLLGSQPAVLAENAAKAAELGAIGIDLNFGCPAKTVNRHRGGACLLDETTLLYNIVRDVRQSVPSHLPVTAKIRLGNHDRLKFIDNALAIEAAGATELFIHARTRADAYKPPAHWACIAEAKTQLAIPIVANGEIWTKADYQQCHTDSGCDDIMIGRGLLANPSLALEIKAVNPAMSWNDIRDWLDLFFCETSQAYPNKFLGNRVKQWLHYMKQHFPEAARLFEQIKRSRDFDTIRQAIKLAS